MLFISGCKCINVCVYMHACIHVCVCMHAWVFGYLAACTCVHTCVCACMRVCTFCNTPPPQSIASLGIPPHNIEKLPTPMIYIGHVQNGAIFFVVMHGLLNVYGGGRNLGRLQHVSYLFCMTSLKSMTSLNSFFYYVITDPPCFLENNIL